MTCSHFRRPRTACHKALQTILQHLLLRPAWPVASTPGSTTRYFRTATQSCYRVQVTWYCWSQAWIQLQSCNNSRFYRCRQAAAALRQLLMAVVAQLEPANTQPLHTLRLLASSLQAPGCAPPTLAQQTKETRLTQPARYISANFSICSSHIVPGLHR